MKLVLLVAISYALTAFPVYACDEVWVIQDDKMEAALKELPAVFVGRVNTVELVGPDSLLGNPSLTPIGGLGRRATFAVIHAWKGPTGTIAVDWYSNCDTAFEVGETYVVFGERQRSEIANREVLVAPIRWESRSYSTARETILGLNAAADRLKEADLELRVWERAQ